MDENQSLEPKPASYNDLVLQLKSLEGEVRGLRIDRSREKLSVRSGIAVQIAAASGAAYAFNHYLGDTAYSLGTGIGKGLHALETATAIFNHGSEKGISSHYLSTLPDNVRQDYIAYSNEGYFSKALKASNTALQGFQRASEHTPGAQSAPIQGLRSMKQKIFEKTIPLVTGKSKEDTQKRGTQEFTHNYNDLVQLRDEAYQARGKLEIQLGEQSSKLAANEAVQGAPDKDGRETLVKLVREYNGVSKLIDDMSRLTKENVDTIYKGSNNLQYAQVIQQADKYGLKPYTAEHAGDIALGVGLLASAIIGYKIAKPFRWVGPLSVSAGRHGVRGVAGAGRVMGRGYGGAKSAGYLIGKKISIGFKNVKTRISTIKNRWRKARNS
ncbi:hypothetical protein KW805_01560 [Candidatus Pacearchaeota archaeon]|nr:hypothetical protein [Candidatus Pacearchaeota archaeon]